MSLKEIKVRIASVGNTRKTTSAMKMVSSVKLRKAQQAVQNAHPYVAELDRILSGLVGMPDFAEMPLMHERPVSNVAIIAISSDSSLCGGFNSNIIRHAGELYRRYRDGMDPQPLFYTIGQKITESFQKSGIEVNAGYSDLVATRDYHQAADLADDLMEIFLNGKLDRVVLTYTHFKSPGSQVIVDETLLPLSVPEDTGNGSGTDYILEPSAEGLLQTLLPKVIRMKLYSAVLDSYCSEQAARVIAMQAATDNADNLLGELRLQYNKLRQQAITNELLDLAGGQIDK